MPKAVADALPKASGVSGTPVNSWNVIPVSRTVVPSVVVVVAGTLILVTTIWFGAVNVTRTFRRWLMACSRAVRSTEATRAAPLSAVAERRAVGITMTAMADITAISPSATMISTRVKPAVGGSASAANASARRLCRCSMSIPKMAGLARLLAG